MTRAMHRPCLPISRICKVPCNRLGAVWYRPAPKCYYSTTATRTYEEAVNLLNSLQTPFNVFEQRRKSGIEPGPAVGNEQMRLCLPYVGHSVNDLDKLNIVHVAGTKGKGTTCAYVNSILSECRKSRGIPKKIGLYTSPHLIAVRERIRIDSEPISRDVFAKYFFEVWDALVKLPYEKPTYFRFLTLMSYHVFLQEGVEVAIYETGMGGEFDSTNIVKRPAVTGITTLGIDHILYLGNTIREIAWHKAGIQKPGCPSYTTFQPPPGLEAIRQRAKERGVSSIEVSRMDERLRGVNVQPEQPFQRANASLAVCLASTVLKKLDPTFSMTWIPLEFKAGIEKMVWRGRCEMKVDGNITWYLDGAHTSESILCAAKWFNDSSLKINAIRVLIFNQQGDRHAEELVKQLFKCTYNAVPPLKFDHVIFCTNAPREGAYVRKDSISHMQDATAVADLTLQKRLAEVWHDMEENHTKSSSSAKIQVLPCVEDAIDYVREVDYEQNYKEETGEITEERTGKKEAHALITGSLHLVGQAISVLDGVNTV